MISRAFYLLLIGCMSSAIAMASILENKVIEDDRGIIEKVIHDPI